MIKSTYQLLLVVFFLIGLHAGSIKCSKCGFMNSEKDRYCLECFVEIREISGDETIKQKNILQNKVTDSYQKAASYFKKAENSKDIKKAISLYQSALRNAVSAISYGKENLPYSSKDRLIYIKEKSESSLTELRKKTKASSNRVKLQKKGNGLYLKVMFNKKVEADMHLDTGCDTILISPEIAKALNIKKWRKQLSVVADGRVVESKGIKLESVDVDGHIINNVPAIILDTKGDGLLGMSFLKHFKFEIDHKNNELILKPRR